MGSDAKEPYGLKTMAVHISALVDGHCYQVMTHPLLSGVLFIAGIANDGGGATLCR